MNYRIEILSIAEEEIDDAVDWYDAEKTNLSAEFVLALDNVLQYIAEKPKLFPIVHNEMRRATLSDFPYAIIFEIHEPDVILVLAVAHQRQNPKRCMKR